MALDFTDIPDEKGAAVYFIHSGITRSEAKMQRLMEEVAERSDKQLVLLDGTRGDGARVIDLYDLQRTEHILVVADNDQLLHFWSEHDRVSADQILFYLNRAG